MPSDAMDEHAATGEVAAEGAASTSHGLPTETASSAANQPLPQASTVETEVDDDDTDEYGIELVPEDSDSAIAGISIMSSTESVRSSIFDHVEENGRTYHRYKGGKYALPNDAEEQDRLDLQHALTCLTHHGKLFLAPIQPDKISNALDLATGTGIWAIEFASAHPNVSVLGTDLSAIQPAFVPPNCRFEIDDAEDEWNFRQKFDYVHGRALLSCFQDPSAVIQQAYNALEPGGYLELQDGLFPMRYLGETPTESHIYKWGELIVEASIKFGRPWTNVQHYPRWMKEIGFVEVEEKPFVWPQSAWAKGKHMKLLSAYFQADMLQGLESFTLRMFTSQLGWTREQVLAFLVGVRKDFKDLNIHAYMATTVTWGRKPFPNEVR